MMIVDLYDPNTLFYTESYTCQENSMQPGDFIKPINAAESRVNLVAGFWPKWTNNNWEQIPDFRSVPVFDKTNGKLVEYDFIGQLPDNLTAVAPSFQYSIWQGKQWVFDIETAKNVKIKQINNAFINTVQSGFQTSFNITMNCDITDIQRLKSAYDLAVLMVQNELSIVVDYFNVSHANVALTQVLQMIIETGSYYQSLYTKKQQKRSEIDNALNELDLAKVVW